MVTISLRILESLATEVAAAGDRGVSESAPVREAIETLLGADEAAQPRSALDLAHDLAGTCEGPEDLSTNKKYMEVFGE